MRGIVFSLIIHLPIVFVWNPWEKKSHLTSSEQTKTLSSELIYLDQISSKAAAPRRSSAVQRDPMKKSFYKNFNKKSSPSGAIQAKLTGGKGKSKKSLFRYFRPRAPYPELARKKGWEGRVIVKMISDSQGQISKASIYSSSSFRLLDQQALATAKTWRIDPHQTYLVPFTFVLND